MLKLIRPFLLLIERIAPQINARMAFQAISKPKVRPMRDFERAIEAEADQATLSFKHFSIRSYRWGKGAKQALLIHGWEGRAANFGAIVPLLVAQGYTVYAYDAPCHGNSSRGSITVFDYAAFVKMLLVERTYDLLMSHSFGSVALTTALYELQPFEAKDIVVLTSPDRFIDRIEEGVAMMGLTYRTRDALVNMLRENTPYDPDTASVSGYVKSIPAQRIWLIHDTADRVLPYEWSERIQANWNGAVLKPISGTGHFRMLWSEPIKGLLEEFVREGQ